LIIFLPVGREEAEALRDGVDLGGRRGCAPTANLRAGLGAETSNEEAEFAALNNAGVLAVLINSDPRRLVLAADVEAAQTTDLRSSYGEISATEVAWPQVAALFADAPEAAAAVDQARRATVDGRNACTLPQAMITAEVAELLDSHDLLWFSPEELDHLD
jgi:hypothetical protein